MKILVIADEESQKIWDFFRKEDYADIDLVISCGDLKADYLSFIATMIAVPVLYVHGNHDEKYDRTPPEDPCPAFSAAAAESGPAPPAPASPYSRRPCRKFCLRSL